MAENSNIEWTRHTWNPWTGCTKVSEGCRYCYMYREKERYRPEGEKWDALTEHQQQYYDPTIVLRSEGNFKKPLTWHKKLTGQEPLTERLVFTCSYSDFFHEDADGWRPEAWEIIRKTPNLVYQILTKRPERVLDCLPSDWGEKGYPNVWLGTTVENQQQAHNRLKLLWLWTAAVKWVSFEPLLGPIDLYDIPTLWTYDFVGEEVVDKELRLPFDWVIVGGESGNQSGKYRFRPCELSWLQGVVDVCQASGIPVFVKQLGTYLNNHFCLNDHHGRDWSYWPEALRVRQFPQGIEVPKPVFKPLQPDLFS